MNLRIVVIAAVVFLAIIAYFAFNKSDDKPDQLTPSPAPAVNDANKPYSVAKTSTTTVEQQQKTPSPSAEQDAQKPVVTDEVAKRITQMQARRPNTDFDPVEVQKALAAPAAWSPEAKPELADQLNVSEEDRYDSRAFIDFNPLKIETLQPGDTMELPIPQEVEKYEMTVTEVIDNRDGTVTWRGRVNGYDRQNQVTITRDNHNTYFSMHTPDHNYVVHAKGEAAFVVQAGVLFKVPEGAETDAVIPPDRRPHEQHNHSTQP